jgi:hypothetical protein
VREEQDAQTSRYGLGDKRAGDNGLAAPGRCDQQPAAAPGGDLSRNPLDNRGLVGPQRWRAGAGYAMWIGSPLSDAIHGPGCACQRNGAVLYVGH